MKILVVAATELEIPFFIKENKNCDVLITGVGIPATVYHLTKKIFGNKYDLIIQAGIGGSFNKKIKRGDVVIVEQDAFADIGIDERKKFKTIFKYGFADANKFPFTNEWLINNTVIIKINHLKKVNAITINTITDRKKQIQKLNKNFNADVESMEGAALHYVCLQQNIEFVQLRSISNKVGERDKTKWKMKEAIENLNKELNKLIIEITSLDNTNT